MTDAATSTSPVTQPVLFIPHGAGPCFFMEWSPPDAWHGMADFLRNIRHTLPEQPRGIVMVSAHWLAEDFRVTTGEQPDLIYDYNGFPPHTYELKYPAPGDPALATRVTSLLSRAGLGNGEDSERGFDHGMFIPLKLMFPAADIPVVQLSLRADLDPAAHQAAGKALLELRDQGILIIGSGMSFHNMRGYGDERFTPLSEEFDRWLTDTMEMTSTEREDRLNNWASAPHALQCHPRGHEEHLLPLMVAAGAAGKDTGDKVYSGQVLKTQLSSWRFG